MTLQGLILVPLDGSDLAEKALPVAAELARRTGASLRLVHVHVPIAADPIYVEGLPVIDEHMRSLRHEHEQAYLDQARQRLAAGVAVSVALLDGPPAATLAAHAQASGAALVVMTTHGRGGLERAWLGSMADELVHLSPVPLLLLRPEPGSVPSPFRRTLVPLDGSARAESILEHVLELARLEPAAELVLLDVVQPIASTVWTPGAALTSSVVTADVTQRQEEHARHYLDGVARRLQAAGVGVRTRIELAAGVASAILDVARDEQAGLVALATHGRSGLARLALGSIADKVVRGSRTPVLLFGPSWNPVSLGANG
jgi:nucleotide-binding universal stress UspA family protein